MSTKYVYQAMEEIESSVKGLDHLSKTEEPIPLHHEQD